MCIRDRFNMTLERETLKDMRQTLMILLTCRTLSEHTEMMTIEKNQCIYLMVGDKLCLLFLFLLLLSVSLTLSNSLLYFFSSPLIDLVNPSKLIHILFLQVYTIHIYLYIHKHTHKYVYKQIQYIL